MQRFLLLFLLFTSAYGLNAQVVLEDFEDGMADLPWNAYEGTFTAAVGNPETATINTSALVGSYTKAGDKPYSYFVAELADPLDLSVNNRFSIQVYAGAATQLLFRLEKRGGGSEAIQQTVNISQANVWRTYTFDFSAAADREGLDNIVLFFDPGVATSADTYLFDNIVASPAGPCAGTVVNASILDDFECQRNATYAEGLDDLKVIANPDKQGINESDSVGQYTDRRGPLRALAIDYNAPLNLSTNNRICMKVWAPVAGELRFTLAGGTRADVATSTEITEDQTEQWIEVCQDFSTAAGGGYQRIAFLFNTGAENTEDNVYYIDDITRTAAPTADVALEDFEGGQKLAWAPLDNNVADNGTFTGPIVNPDRVGNTSATIGSYQRAATDLSTLTAALPSGLDLRVKPQLNLDVWAPMDGARVTLQLFSPTAGLKAATVTMGPAQSWQTLSFNFVQFAGVNDFERINILFDPNTSGTDTYLFDNLIQRAATVSACVDVRVNPTVLDDYDCQRNADYTNGGESLTVIDNPDMGDDSPNRSARVGRFIDQPGGDGVLTIDKDSVIDLSLRNQFSATVWTEVAGQLVFRMEGDGVAPVQVTLDIDTLGAWSTYTADFSAAAGRGYTRVSLVFGAGADNTTATTYYVDDIRLTRLPFSVSCVSTFEDVDFNVTDWQYFENGPMGVSEFSVVTNPDSSGLNNSLLVGTFVEDPSGLDYAGIYTDLEAPISLPSGKKFITMKVLTDVAGPVLLKLERGLNGTTASGDVIVQYTTPGEWQELTFDFSALPDGARFSRLTLIPNIGVVPTAVQTHYFDDISVGGGDCATLVSLFSPMQVVALRAYPNPTNDELTIENIDGASLFTLTNLLGQQVKQLKVESARTQVQWSLADLPRGTYLLTGQDRAGRLVARSKVVKR